MKQKVKFFACLFFLVVWASGMEAVAAKKAKEYHESWPSNSVTTLEISNKFGDVNVAYKGGSNVTVDVIITVESSNERKIDDLLEQISVSFSKTGNTVTAETHFSRGFSTRLQFSVDYKVNIPPDKNLNITNKYGNAFVNELNASGSFDISYGNFDANQLKAPADGLVELELAYGKGGVESANNLLVEVQYSTINFGNLGELDLDSKYSIINIDKAGSVIADSKYDTFNFGLVGALSSTTKYTRIKVRELSQKLIVDAGYGGIKVDKVDENFESVQITNSYGQISLGLGNANYLLDASCDYCGISYPESNFSGNRISERQMRKVNGKVGSGTGGTVFVKSRYGQINLD
ncbi:hypothetical protein SAMN05444274_104396 [Mariniphaga anaerophila]|uniref:Adhesin domain-containing protein n=1 Tax=Mariniphaga anaerophila TaxID=1484053 RepID=A0A1M5AMK4_9BACT|nr:hypothetical protein [Mariniphaga anaerophila]SHF31469.1 hypothetical protein SAMN05444274_104396 [Mariniphaga anaerophila]